MYIKKRKFYAFPIDVLKRVRPTADGGKLSHFDSMLGDALYYALFATYESAMRDIGESVDFAEDVFKAAMAALGIGSANYGKAKQVFKYYENAKVITALSTKVYWDLVENAERRGQEYMLEAMAAMALKSILGAFAPSSAKVIGWDFILSRMEGHPKSSKKHLKHTRKLATRRMREKMIKALCDYWGFSYYAPKGTRGGWFALGMKPKELAEYVGRRTKMKRQKMVHL